MQNTKLVLIMMIGLAIIEFSIVQSSNAAATATGPTPSVASARKIAPSTAVKAKANKSMKGLAAVYSDKFNGRKTASGQKFCQSQLTAAHRVLPLGTNVRVTNLRNNKSVEVRINDRGPFHGSRVIDLSTAAAAEVGMKKTGIALVQLEVISKPATKNS